MTTTLTISPTFDRSRSAFRVAPVAVVSARGPVTFHACAPAAPTAATTLTMTDASNLWLGGVNVQGAGLGSEYSTKRITPGRLEGMT